ncbi:MAG: ATP-binding protein [Pyrinomonadaceae bacterium]|nr:ATP-binding protein [Pyrinomonadaceae bacterium]
MASILKQAESLQVKIEKYIKRIAGFIPSVKGDEDLLSFLAPILKQDSERNKCIRVALGFPAKIETSRMLSRLISSGEASVRPMTNVWAQRMYQFLWRLESTVREIDASWQEPVLGKIEAAQKLCEPHLLARRPNLPEISGALKFKTNVAVVSESAADATLFAVLRAFELREEDQLLWATADELSELRKSALDFLFDYILNVLKKDETIDDSSNLWWGLRVGTCAGDPRFLDLIGPMAANFRKIVVPAQIIQGRSVLPEIYREVRTASYTLSNIQAILETGVKIDQKALVQLKSMIGLMVKALLTTTHSRNLYLACVHHEGLGNYLDYSRDEGFAGRIHNNVLKLADFTPVVDYACGDAGLEEQVVQVRSWLEKKPAKRNAVLVYGASSTGKSFLVEKLFKQFRQEDTFKESRIICASNMNFSAELAELSQKIHARKSEEYPPFIFIDEIDVEFSDSLYPQLLKLLDTGTVPDFTGTLERFILFWGGGKHGSVENFKKFLEKNQRVKKFQKGLDFYNRTKQKIDLPFSLFRNKNHKIVVGVSEIARAFSLPVRIDWSVIANLKRLPAERGAREFAPFVERLKKDDTGVVIQPGEATTHNVLNVQE